MAEGVSTLPRVGTTIAPLAMSCSVATLNTGRQITMEFLWNVFDFRSYSCWSSWVSRQFPLMRAIGPTLVEGNNTSQLRANAMSITARIMESLIPQKRNITRNPGSWRSSNGLRRSHALCVLPMRQVYNCLWRRAFRSQITSESRLELCRALLPDRLNPTWAQRHRRSAGCWILSLFKKLSGINSFRISDHLLNLLNPR